MSWEDPQVKQAGFLPLGTSVSQGREEALPWRPSWKRVASACQAVGSGLSSLWCPYVHGAPVPLEAVGVGG